MLLERGVQSYVSAKAMEMDAHIPWLVSVIYEKPVVGLDLMAVTP